MLKKYNQKSLQKRKEERKDFPEFFKKHINNIIQNKEVCMECGCRLKGDVSEVAHILPKQTFKSVSTDDDNVVYLCSWKSKNNCHSKFDDSSYEVVQSMKIYTYLQETVEKLIIKIEEKLNWKFYKKWNI